MSLREEQCKKVCRILDDVLANRPTERDSLIVAVQLAFESLSEPHWIPVTERLPETEGRYIVVNSKIGGWRVDIDFYRPYMGGWMYDQGVLAWMPLPEPYKGVTDGNQNT